MSSLHLVLLLLPGALSPAPTSLTTTARQDWCDEPDPVTEAFGAIHCEVRMVMFAPVATVRIDAGPSGDIQVRSAQRRDVKAEARIWVRSSTMEDARSLADRVTIRTDGELRAEMPSPEAGDVVDVSFRVRVPHESDLDLTAQNGHIVINEIHGQIHYETVNGSVLLSSLGGDVQGHTTNGSTRIRLASERWIGAGLDVSVNHGDLHVDRPLGYQTTVDVETVNGVLVSPNHDPYAQDEHLQGHRLTLGGDLRGPVVRAVTGRGDVEVRSL